MIEHSGPGLQLFQEIRATHSAGVPAPIVVKPVSDKFVRISAQSARFEAGQVYLPEQAPWLAAFLHELLAFPNARNDDQVDSVSQFLGWAQRRYALLYVVSGTYPKVMVYTG